jgi:hypothetical protein
MTRRNELSFHIRRRMCGAALLGALAFALCATAQAAPRKKRKAAAPAKKASAPAATPAAKPAEEAAPPAPALQTPKKAEEPADDRRDAPGALGVSLTEGPLGLSAGEPLPGGLAKRMGLAAGDQVTALPLRARLPAARLYAIALRGLDVRRLDSPASETPRSRPREDGKLSPREQTLKEARLTRASEAGAAQAAAAPPLDFVVHAKQAFWLRFPAGIPAGPAAGAVFVGEMTTAVATDSSLDFLSLPPRTKVWARIASAEPAGEELKTLRLELFKLQPAGGHVYRAAGWVTDIAEGSKLARVTPGGTLVQAALSDPKAAQWAVPPDMKLRAELREPLTLTEAPRFYRAGPGLWIRSKDTPQGRRFEVSHVIAGRAADRAGLRPGALLTSIGGRSAEKLDFTDGLDALYGEPGTEVKVSVEDVPGKTRTLSLSRGVLFEKDVPARLPLPTAR